MKFYFTVFFTVVYDIFLKQYRLHITENKETDIVNLLLHITLLMSVLFFLGKRSHCGKKHLVMRDTYMYGQFFKFPSVNQTVMDKDFNT